MTSGRLQGMKTFMLALLIATLALAFGGSASAGCALCVDSVAAQTRDGAAWSSGQPVLLVFNVSRADRSAAFPADGLAVVMAYGRERTKCLDVQLRKTSESGDAATYAGGFYPFGTGTWTGRVDIGGNPQDFRVDVGEQSAANAEPTVVRDPERSAALELLPYLLPLTLFGLPFLPALRRRLTRAA